MRLIINVLHLVVEQENMITKIQIGMNIPQIKNLLNLLKSELNHYIFCLNIKITLIK